MKPPVWLHRSHGFAEAEDTIAFLIEQFVSVSVPQVDGTSDTALVPYTLVDGTPTSHRFVVTVTPESLSRCVDRLDC
jgi:hypothetical protein